MKKIFLVLALLVLSGGVFLTFAGCSLGHTHTLVKVDEQAATCEAEGNELYYKCSCGSLFRDAEGKKRTYLESVTIPATGHNYSSWTTTTEATCQHVGAQKRTCSVCGNVETRTLSKLDHSYSDWTTTTEATCAKTGVETRTCSVCGNEDTRITLKLTTHSYGEWTTTTEATCAKTGTKTRTCSVCGNEDTRITPKLTTHSYGEWTTTTEATCAKAGTKTRTCSVCGNVEYGVLNKTSHALSDWQYDADTHWKECATCHQNFSTASHSFVEESTSQGTLCVCECGYSYYPEFTTSGSSITGLTTYGKTLSTIVIPSSINGTKITSIAANAFKDNATMTSVTIPEGITSIGSYAFDGCTKITSITIPCSVTSIGSFAFDDCTGLTSITIPSSVTSIGKCVFGYCSALESITVDNANTSYKSQDNCLLTFDGKTLVFGCKNSVIPSSVTSIGTYAFYGCTGLTSITIPEGITSIGYFAFSGCSGLTSITISSSVTSIGSDAFYDCNGLTAVYITDLEAWCNITFSGSSSNPTYYAKHLYLNGTEITDLVIPSSITQIKDYAFYNCSSLTSITIPSSVTSIGKCVFGYCSALESVTVDSANTMYKSEDNCLLAYDGKKLVLGCKNSLIPSSVTSIGTYAFYGCTGLTSITIPSSVTSIGSDGFRGCTALTEINYNAASCAGLSYSSGAFIRAGTSGTGITVTIGDSVETIPAHLFAGANITSVTIGVNVTSIGNYAFRDCTALTEINYNATSCADLTGGSRAFENAGKSGTGITVTFGDSVEKIPAYLFTLSSSTCAPNITSVTIPSSVTSIGNHAFWLCTSLTSVTFAENSQLTSIGEKAFRDCTGLTSVTIGKNVTSIGSSAFEGCSGLNSVTFAENSQLTSIGYSAFSGCTGLTSITIPSSVTSIGSSAFEGCSGLNSVTFAENSQLASIGSCAFYGCSGLNSVTFAENSQLTSIGSSVFSGCTGLTSIIIPNSVTSIGYSAFSGCTGLTSITIPSSVTSIETCAFYRCTGLTKIYIPSSVTTIPGSNYTLAPFRNCSSTLKIYCGASSKPSGWGDYWNYYDSGKTLSVTWGVTPEEFAALGD